MVKLHSKVSVLELKKRNTEKEQSNRERFMSRPTLNQSFWIVDPEVEKTKVSEGGVTRRRGLEVPNVSEGKMGRKDKAPD